MDEQLPQTGRTNGRRLRTLGGLAAAGIGITLGAAGISAAATNPSPSPSNSSAVVPADPGPAGPGRHRGVHRDPLGLRGAVRGTLVVPDGKGGWRTLDVQRGTATDVTTAGFTVTSKDGVAKTYHLTSTTKVMVGRGTPGTIASGDLVGVVATTSGDALGVRDLTKMLAARGTQDAPPAGAPMGLDGPSDLAGL